MKALADATVPRWFPASLELNVGGRREAYVHDMITSTPVEGFAASARALQGYDVMPGLSDALKGHQVLLVAGERDGTLPGVLSKVAETLKGDGVDAKFESVPNCGHLPMIDGPRQWLDIVEPFLDA